jgi:hypothetical protein
MYIKYRVGFCAIFFVKDQRGAEDNGSKSESLYWGFRYNGLHLKLKDCGITNISAQSKLGCGRCELIAPCGFIVPTCTTIDYCKSMKPGLLVVVVITRGFISSNSSSSSSNCDQSWVRENLRVLCEIVVNFLIYILLFIVCGFS